MCGEGCGDRCGQKVHLWVDPFSLFRSLLFHLILPKIPPLISTLFPPPSRLLSVPSPSLPSFVPSPSLPSFFPVLPSFSWFLYHLPVLSLSHPLFFIHALLPLPHLFPFSFCPFAFALSIPFCLYNITLPLISHPFQNHFTLSCTTSLLPCLYSSFLPSTHSSFPQCPFYPFLNPFLYLSTSQPSPSSKISRYLKQFFLTSTSVLFILLLSFTSSLPASPHLPAPPLSPKSAPFHRFQHPFLLHPAPP